MKCLFPRFQFAFHLFICPWWIFGFICYDFTSNKVVQLFYLFFNICIGKQFIPISHVWCLLNGACLCIFVIPNKPLVRFGIHDFQVKFGACNLMMKILIKQCFNSAVNYKLRLIFKNEISPGWWILEGVFFCYESD